MAKSKDVKASPLLSRQAKPHECSSTKHVPCGKTSGSAKLFAFLGIMNTILHDQSARLSLSTVRDQAQFEEHRLF
jgi:hypothetical protein